MILVALFIIPFLLFHNNVIGDVIASSQEPLHSFLVYIDATVSIAAMLLLYRAYVSLIERRPAYEISLQKAPVEFGFGALISLGIVAGMVALMSLPGHYRIDHIGSGKVLVDALFLFGIGAFVQELGFRLVLFRLTEEFLGSWIALGAIAVVFGLAHLGNDNATLWTSAALMAADILLTAAFMLTRRLWLVWGIHTGWNFFQDGVFGMANSGVTNLPSWISAETSGPGWLTGGAFGIEASCVVVVVSVAVGALILRVAARRRQVVLPLWLRRRSEVTAAARG
jgi:membrane protease YdiL (CAAX protease family)